MRFRTLTILTLLAVLLQGGGVMQWTHWRQTDHAHRAATACAIDDSHQSSDPDPAPAPHQRDHCPVCLALAAIRPVALVAPVVLPGETRCDDLVVESWDTPHFEVFLCGLGRAPPVHL